VEKGGVCRKGGGGERFGAVWFCMVLGVLKKNTKSKKNFDKIANVGYINIGVL